MGCRDAFRSFSDIGLGVFGDRTLDFAVMVAGRPVTQPQLTMPSAGGRPRAARRLLAVMGLPDSGTETLWQATERLATDPVHRSSIAGALAAARENTRAVRHVVPVYGRISWMAGNDALSRPYFAQTSISFCRSVGTIFSA